jgi:lipoprotein-anchoring transpeptidase ErfK/SrfK
MYGGNRAAGTYYYLRNVPWVQYFYEDYAFHGTTWHANFGRPASRGCINMRTDEAAWLFEWASPTFDGQGWFISDGENPGTLVIVHQ